MQITSAQNKIFFLLVDAFRALWKVGTTQNLSGRLVCVIGIPQTGIALDFSKQLLEKAQRLSELVSFSS